MIDLKNVKASKGHIESLERRENCFSQVAICWAFLGGATLSSSLFASTHDTVISTCALLGVGIVCFACTYVAQKESNKANKEIIELNTQLAKALTNDQIKNQNEVER